MYQIDEYFIERVIHETYGIKNVFTPHQKALCKKWADNHVPLEIISDAFTLAVKKTNNVNFYYADAYIKMQLEKHEKEKKMNKKTTKEKPLC